jgi:hypothetical protein
LGYGLDKKYGKLNKSNIINSFLKLENKKEDSDTVMDEDDLEQKKYFSL